MEEQLGNINEEQPFEIGFEPVASLFLFADIAGLIALIKKCVEIADQKIKRAEIKRLLSAKDLVEITYCRRTGRRVLCESDYIEHAHEKKTVNLLAEFDYDVIFAPKAMFKRDEKRFDVFLIRDTVILKADLKAITSKNADTIAKRIVGGSDQASRVVIDICSDIDKNTLIDGLRSGVERNNLIVEILLIYKNRFYRLPKSLILSKRIYEVLK